MLSAGKYLGGASEIHRFAQDDPVLAQANRTTSEDE
jgi:hypothetical protein